MAIALEAENRSLVFASYNSWKLEEFRRVCAELVGDRLRIISAKDLGLPEPVEDAETFAENATLKAAAAAKATGLVALADDSGFCVTGLNGRPGLHSARWGGPTHNIQIAIDRIYRELGDHPDRSAYFACVPGLAFPDGRTDFVEERLYGTLVNEPRGDMKFGYGCIFVPNGETRVFAELTPEEQYGCNPRITALKKLITKHFVV